MLPTNRTRETPSRVRPRPPAYGGRPVDSTLVLVQQNIMDTLDRVARRDSMYVTMDDLNAFASALLPVVLGLPFTRSRAVDGLSQKSEVHLTLRQRRALIGVARGLTITEVGQSMGLAADTVKSHLRRAYERLDARNAAHAVATAMSLGIITAQDLDQLVR